MDSDLVHWYRLSKSSRKWIGAEPLEDGEISVAGGLFDRRPADEALLVILRLRILPSAQRVIRCRGVWVGSRPEAQTSAPLVPGPLVVRAMFSSWWIFVILAPVALHEPEERRFRVPWPRGGVPAPHQPASQAIMLR